MDWRDHGASTDTDLTIAASRGDDDAFAELYERYAPRITGYLTRLVHDEHLAQDLTHEVFVSALRRLRTDRPPIAVGAWLYRIARNASIDVHRRTQVIRQVPLDGAGEETARNGALDHAPEAAAEVHQGLDHLRYLLEGLSDTHRTVLVLRELEGLSNTEIGDRLGISRPAVEGLLFRARTKVRAEYEDLVSGRRCEAVRETLDRAGGQPRLGRRDARAASRHLGVCPQCRRHAWEAGVVAVVHRRAAATRALLPLPVALGALADRLSGLGRGIAEAPQALAPWGRAAAAVAAVAVAGTAVAPRLAGPGEAPRAPERVALRQPAAAQTASPAATPTALPVDRRATVRSAPVVVPAGAPETSPAAAPVALPPSGAGDEPEAAPEPAATPAEAAPARPEPEPEPESAPTAEIANAAAPAVRERVDGVVEAARPEREQVAELVGADAGHTFEAVAALVGEVVRDSLPETAAPVADAVQEAAEPPPAVEIAVPEVPVPPVPDPVPPPVEAPAAPPAPPVPAPPAVELPEPPASLPDRQRSGPVSLR